MTEPIYKDDETREGINAMTPWGEWGLVEDVAKCAVFLASEDANYVTGEQILDHPSPFFGAFPEV